MANDLTVTSQKLTRDQLSKILPDLRSIKFFENLISDLQNAAAAFNDRDVVNVWTKNQSTAQFDLVDAAVVAVDASQSNGFRLAMQAGRATRLLQNPTKATAGMFVTFELVQPPAGGCGFVFDTAYDFGPQGAPTPTTTPNARDMVLGYFDGTKMQCLFRSSGGANESFVTLTDAAIITPAATRSTNFLLVMDPTRLSRVINVPLPGAPGAIYNFNVVVPGAGYSIIWAPGTPGFKWGRGGQDLQPIGTPIAGTDTYSFQVETDGSPHGVMIGQSGPTGAGYLASSTTSLATVGTGSVAFTTQSGLAYSIGGRFRSTSISTGEFMEGVVASYALGILTGTMDFNSGTGTHADWTINIAGQRGAAGPGGSSNFAGTSTTSNTVGTGSLTFTTQAGLAVNVGARLRISSHATPANYVEGVTTAYSGTSLTILSDAIGGSGTFAVWDLNIAGQPGTGGGSSLQYTEVTGNDAASINVTSTSYVNLTGFVGSVNAVVGHRVLIEFSSFCFSSAGLPQCTFGALVNGSVLPVQPLVAIGVAGNAPTFTVRIPRTVVAGDLVAGVFTAQLQVKVNTGTFTIANVGGIDPVYTVTNFGP